MDEIILKSNLSTRHMAGGNELKIPIYTIKGSDENAPTVYIQSSLHGSEIQGYLVCIKLLEYFNINPPRGNITIVPLCNPYGIQQKVGSFTHGRFDPWTGENWNRNFTELTCLSKNHQIHEDQIILEDFFKNAPQQSSLTNLKKLFKDLLSTKLKNQLLQNISYGKKLSTQLQLLASPADIVLDLHCDTDSLPHIYSPEYALTAALDLQIPYIISIPEVFADAMDEACFMPWVHFTKSYNEIMNPEISIENPFLAFTLELGSEENIDKKSAQQQLEGILSFLAANQVITKNKSISPPTSKSIITPLNKLITLYAPHGGIILEKPELGVLKNAKTSILEISTLISEGSRLPEPHHLTYHKDCIPLTRPRTAIVHEGSPLMKVITQ